MHISQSDYVKVKEAVLQKFESFYKLEFSEEYADAIVDDLKDYAKFVLDEAMKNLRRRLLKAPTVSQIISQCESIKKNQAPAGAAAGSGNKQKNPWEEKQLKLYNMHRHLIAAFRTSGEYIGYTEEGIETECDRYVRAVAHLQGQIICGLTAGYSTQDIFPHLYPVPDEILEEFMREIRMQAMTGEMKVIIPENVLIHFRNRRDRVMQKPTATAAREVPVSARMGETKSVFETAMEHVDIDF